MGANYRITMFDWSDCSEVNASPDTVSGAFIFRGTRVPVKALFENLEDGATVDDFLQWFPGESNPFGQHVVVERNLIKAFLREFHQLFCQGDQLGQLTLYLAFTGLVIPIIVVFIMHKRMSLGQEMREILRRQ